MVVQSDLLRIGTCAHPLGTKWANINFEEEFVFPRNISVMSFYFGMNVYNHAHIL